MYGMPARCTTNFGIFGPERGEVAVLFLVYPCVFLFRRPAVLCLGLPSIWCVVVYIQYDL